MDLSKLSNGQKVGLVGGLVLIINLFLPWFTSKVAGLGTGSGNAFDFWLAWLGSFLAIAAAVILAIRAFSSTEFKLGTLAMEQIALVLAALGTLLILIKLIIGESAEGAELYGISISRGVGIFLGLIAAGVVTVGCFMAMKEKGLAMPDADDFRSLGGGGGAPPPPPPPPA
jgi:cellobiose-specific phosphotransferase system component IIC